MSNHHQSSLAMNRTNVRLFMQLLPLRFVIGSLGFFSPVLAARKAAQLFSRPRAGRAPDVPPALMAQAQAFHLDIDGGRIAVCVWGRPESQPRVLLAHGWGGQGLQMHRFVQPLLATGHAVVTFDQPAHGRSDGTSATLPRFARVIRAVAEHFGGVDSIVSHSLGAAASALALRDGMPARRVVLVAPPASLTRAAHRFARALRLPGRVYAEMLAHFDRSEGIDIEALQARNMVQDIGTPALIVHDLGDAEVPWADGEQYARYWPGARLLSTDGLGHRRILADPSVVAAACDWIASKPVGSRVIGTRNLAPHF